MLRTVGVLLACAAVLIAVAFSQTRSLTNDDVIQMVKAGFDEQTIIKAIQADVPKFDTSVQGLVALKNAGVPKTIMDAILDAEARSNSPAPATSPNSSGTPSANPASSTKDEWPAEVAGMYREVGIYYKENGKFMQLFGKPVVATHTGGFLKSSFTMGLSKVRSKGQLPGKHAELQLAERQPVFYFYMPENQTPDDFSVIRLETKGGERRFQVGSAGGASASVSTGLDVHKVSQILIERIAPRLYRVTPGKELEDGEYGFIGTLAAFGVGGGEKLYDFGIHVRRKK